MQPQDSQGVLNSPANLTLFRPTKEGETLTDGPKKTPAGCTCTALQDEVASKDRTWTLTFLELCTKSLSNPVSWSICHTGTAAYADRLSFVVLCRQLHLTTHVCARYQHLLRLQAMNSARCFEWPLSSWISLAAFAVGRPFGPAASPRAWSLAASSRLSCSSSSWQRAEPQAR